MYHVILLRDPQSHQCLCFSLLLDAMYIAMPIRSVDRKPTVFSLSEFQPRQDGIPLERPIPTSNNSDPIPNQNTGQMTTPHLDLNPNPNPNANNVISINNSNVSPEPESIPVSGPVPPPPTQISLNIVNVPPSVARGAHFSPHPTHMNGNGSGTATVTASTDPSNAQPAATGRRRTSQVSPCLA